jgi:hypothetical protein
MSRARDPCASAHMFEGPNGTFPIGNLSLAGCQPAGAGVPVSGPFPFGQ